MTTVGVETVKSQLRRPIKLTASGDKIDVLKKGRPFARLIQLAAKAHTALDAAGRD